MQLDLIGEFIDLAETLSFMRSAENLCISQPTLSRHIADLERQVGAQLFERTTSSVRLTRAGRVFYQTANAMRASYDEALSAIKGVPTAEYARVRCGGSVIHPAVNRTFVRLAGRACALDLPIRFEYGKTRPLAAESPSVYALDLLRSGELDLVVDPHAPDSEVLDEFDAVPVWREPYRVLAAADNTLAGRPDVTLERLAEQTLVLVAVYRHCPALITYPFRAAGALPRAQKTVFVGDVLEIAEHLAGLASDEFVLLQDGFWRSFGWGEDGLGTTVVLDTSGDARLEVCFWALMRKGDATPAMRCARDLLEQMRV